MSDEGDLESIRRIRVTVNKIVNAIEENHQQKRRDKNKRIEKLNKQIAKFCINNEQQFTTGYSVAWLKKILQELLKIIEEQDQRLKQLEN